MAHLDLVLHHVRREATKENLASPLIARAGGDPRVLSPRGRGLRGVVPENALLLRVVCVQARVGVHVLSECGMGVEASSLRRIRCAALTD